jgi:hypothetical protein
VKSHVAMVGLMVVVPLAIALAVSHDTGLRRHSAGREPLGRLTPSPPYPEEWKTTLAGAQVGAKFPVVLPNDTMANSTNVNAAYVWPGGAAVAFDFPAPQAQSTVRQGYIEVWESVWAGGDPLKAFQADLAADPVEGKSIIDINGVPALAVTANSPSDFEQANPAFIRFVVNGLDIQVSGGDNLDALIRIAATISSATPSA